MTRTELLTQLIEQHVRPICEAFLCVRRYDIPDPFRSNFIAWAVGRPMPDSQHYWLADFEEWVAEDPEATE